MLICEGLNRIKNYEGDFRPEEKDITKNMVWRDYFCCLNRDFYKYFEPSSKAVLADKEYAKEFYYRGSEDILFKSSQQEAEFKEVLYKMSRFIVIVTKDFLYTENFAKDVELAFAIEHKRRIFPILTDEALIEDFNKLCENIQVRLLEEEKYSGLDEAFSDIFPPRLPKIGKNDFRPLVHDIERAIRANFFISYRKRDWHLLKQMIKKIHNIDEFFDLSFWHDDYLVVGRDFNSDIEEHLEKSNIVLLMITPRILEEPNYVLDVELPMAKKLGKTIIPIEMEHTDRDMLWNICGVRDPVSIDDRETLTLRINEALKENNLYRPMRGCGEKEVKAYIGEGYLYGFVLEKDVEKGLELLNKAKESGSLRAYYRLIYIYENGEIVDKDPVKAAKLQGELAKLLYDKEGASTNVKIELNKASKRYSELKLYEKVLDINLILYAIAKKEYEVNLNSIENLILFGGRVAFNYHQLGKDEIGLDYWEEHLKLLYILHEKDERKADIREIISIHSLLTANYMYILKDINKDTAPEFAILYYEKAIGHILKLLELYKVHYEKGYDEYSKLMSCLAMCKSVATLYEKKGNEEQVSKYLGIREEINRKIREHDYHQ